MWLSAASGRACYNLDFNVMDSAELGAFYAAHAGGELRLIETNKGLFDGMALDGSDSNAALATLLKTPVVLVVDTNGMTRGIAPLLQGYQGFQSDVEIAGVILNKVGGARHEAKLRAAVETFSDIPVLGAVWRNTDLEIGERHLGLTTPAETGGMAERIAAFAGIMADSVDLDSLLDLARGAPPLPFTAPSGRARPPTADLRIAIARDKAFGFYYPDDLEAFAAAGAELVPFDSLSDEHLPAGIDGLFIGGGFPETQMAALAANRSMRASIKAAIAAGLPAYAECGGLMYLCETLEWQGEVQPMVGVISARARMCPRPQGRGYARFRPTPAHLWNPSEHMCNAHEFHYARLDDLPEGTVFAREIARGAGIDGQHDAIVTGNLIAGFCHLRTSATNPWANRFVAFVRDRKGRAGTAAK